MNGAPHQAARDSDSESAGVCDLNLERSVYAGLWVPSNSHLSVAPESPMPTITRPSALPCYLDSSPIRAGPLQSLRVSEAPGLLALLSILQWNDEQ